MPKVRYVAEVGSGAIVDATDRATTSGDAGLGASFALFEASHHLSISVTRTPSCHAPRPDRERSLSVLDEIGREQRPKTAASRAPA
jgi:hypothetical protein